MRNQFIFHYLDLDMFSTLRIIRAQLYHSFEIMEISFTNTLRFYILVVHNRELDSLAMIRSSARLQFCALELSKRRTGEIPSGTELATSRAARSNCSCFIDLLVTNEYAYAINCPGTHSALCSC